MAAKPQGMARGKTLAALAILAASAVVFALSASSVARSFLPSEAAGDDGGKLASLPPQSLATLAFLAARGAAGENASFALPVNHSEARVSGLFGWRENPLTGEGREFHEGLDIAAPKGAAVGASRDGRVVASFEDRSTGQTVELMHADGTLSVYAHLSERLCAPGEIVARGETIGRVGYSGRVTGPHLHFALKKDGAYFDPLPFMTEGEALYAALRR